MAAGVAHGWTTLGADAPKLVHAVQATESLRWAVAEPRNNHRETIMGQQFLPGASEFVVFIVLLLGLGVLEWAGWRVGQHYREGADEAARSQVGALHAAVLGMLALLLGFTFSMAADRFDSRRELIVEEANSIDTANLRGDLLPEPARSAFKALLKRYVDIRIEFYKDGNDDSTLRANEAEAERIHAQLWPLAIAEAHREPTPPIALLLDVLNRMIDLHSSRTAALSNHVPAIVIWMVLFVALQAAAITGYAAGFSKRHYRLPVGVTMLLIAAVTLVIIDLDRPRRGLIESGQVAMVELQKRMAHGIPTPKAP
jgi:hypothetical protein